MDPLLEVGHIAKPHGLRGEVVVALITDVAERVAPGSVLTTKKGELTVRSSRRHQHRWIVQFDGVGSREEAEAMHGFALSAPPIEDADALWVHELIGAEVFTPDGRSWGKIEAVESNPASDLLVLENETLVPEVFVIDASGLPDRVVIDPPVGLMEPAD